VLDPEIANALVGVSQGESVRRLRVREQCGIEIQPEVVGLRPVNPTLKVLGFDFVSLYELATVVQVAGVEIQAVPPWNQAESLLDVTAKLIDGPGLPRVVAGRLNASTGEFGAGGFKPSHIVPLPAMERDRNAFEFLQRGIGVDAHARIAFFRNLVCLRGVGFHRYLLPFPAVLRRGEPLMIPSTRPELP
jgi:hypothetical protein